MSVAHDESSALTAPPGVAALLRDLVHEHIGIYFEPDRFDTLLEKLRDRALTHGCSSYLDYYYLLKYGGSGPTEWLRVMDAFSVQETYFWRELAHIRALVDTVLPAWFKRHQLRLHIWSAACATGEEPASIAIALLEAGWGNHPISIHASDASEAALAKARTGVYRERSFRALPPELRARYFDAPTQGGSRLRQELLLPIVYQRANLVVPAELQHLAGAPVIFCRNVFIYFSADAIRRTLASFASRAPAGAHLFVGASEPLLQLTTDYTLHEVANGWVYTRNPRGPA